MCMTPIHLVCEGPWLPATGRRHASLVRIPFVYVRTWTAV